MARADGRWAADYPLLQPDQPDSGFRNNTQEGAEAIDRSHVGRVSRMSDFGTTKRWLGVGAGDGAGRKTSLPRRPCRRSRSPYKSMPALNMSLFLSASAQDVKEAVSAGLPAGQVLPSPAVEEDESDDLRIAFDFDGVLADDASEGVMQEGGLRAFREHEVANLTTPHNPGLLEPFLAAVNRIQDREEADDSPIRSTGSGSTWRSSPPGMPQPMSVRWRAWSAGGCA